MVLEELHKSLFTGEQLYVSEFDPGFTYRFPLDSWTKTPISAPIRGGLYAVLGYAGEYLYIGRTRSLRWRKWRLSGKVISVFSGGDAHSASRFVCMACSREEAKRLVRYSLDVYEQHTGLLPPLHRAGFRPGWF